MFSTGWLPLTHPIFLSSVLDETDGDEIDQQFGLYTHTHTHYTHYTLHTTHYTLHTTHTHTHTHIQTRDGVHTHIQVCIARCIQHKLQTRHTHINTVTHRHTHIQTYTCTQQKYTHTYKQTHTHTDRYVHTDLQSELLLIQHHSIVGQHFAGVSLMQR